MQLKAAQQAQQHMAEVQHKRHCKRAVLRGWQQFVLYRQDKCTNPEGLGKQQLALLHQVQERKRLLLLCQVQTAWWRLSDRAVAAQQKAQTMAAGRQQRVQQRALHVLQMNVLLAAHKRQLQLKADQQHERWLLRSCWGTWQATIKEATAARSQVALRTQHQLWQVLLRWQVLSTSLTAAKLQESQLTALQAGWLTRTASSKLFAAWRIAVLTASRGRALHDNEQLQQQVAELQVELLGEQQQQVASMAGLKGQVEQLQQQLKDALASKAELQVKLLGEQQQQVASMADLKGQVEQLQQQLKDALASKAELQVKLLGEQQQQVASMADHKGQVEQLQQQLKDALASKAELQVKLLGEQQQQVAGMADLKGQVEQLQQQLKDALASKAELQGVSHHMFHAVPQLLMWHYRWHCIVACPLLSKPSSTHSTVEAGHANGT
jgi:hypothetical protein